MVEREYEATHIADVLHLASGSDADRQIEVRMKCGALNYRQNNRPHGKMVLSYLQLASRHHDERNLHTMSPKTIGWIAVILVAISVSPVYGKCYDEKFENLMTVLDVRSKKLAGQEKLREVIKQFVQKKASTDAERRRQSNMRENLTILEEYINAEKEYQKMLKSATRLYISLTQCPVRPRGVFDYITDGKAQPQDREKWDKFKEVYSASFKQRDKVHEVARRAQEALIRQKLESE